MNAKSLPVRDSESTQAWLVGSGIASLTAAVHLIHDAGLPGCNINILSHHGETGGGIRSSGDANHGFVLHPGCLPYFNDESVENLLSLVPSARVSGKSLLDAVGDFELSERFSLGMEAQTRFLRNKEGKCERSGGAHLSIGPYNRLQLLKVLVESENLLGHNQIQHFFGNDFFATDFWVLWSTTFSLRPSYSVIEFQRCLRKHLPNIHSLNDVRTLDRTRFNLYESIILPISTYLRSKGVNFNFNAKVIDIRFDMDDNSSEPTTVTGIVIRQNERERIVILNPNDVAIVTIGSPHSGHQPSVPNDFNYEDWSLWIHLAQKSTKFGVPLNFNSHPQESTLVTFTVTLHGSEFMRLYCVLTHDVPGSGALLLFPDSNWLLSISIPHQPVCSTQPPNTHVIWGYGLRPEKIGNFVDKPMTKCAGRDIMIELLSHLNFPIKNLLPKSITIPCFFPLATSALLPRYPKNRPEVIPPETTNIALVGIFAEIPHDPTFNLEYSVRGAQTAVYQLMGLPKSLPEAKQSLLLDVFDLLVDS
ncbi:hypothetical protein N7509_000241 [Penicillium cosmopolitanum]|uniref:Oleate hydratase n=1 Tax=Penicillium cosmopolitanum TaxID=1131564 RepID=A0A9X0BE09_9EURO|nr:uncharacterized protein N7509_000241 [Penicillium cosmopolitanum]KAJ5413614.1 hypothetical protein N7509_000241 [Penicillium cosmopolitanum]